MIYSCSMSDQSPKDTQEVNGVSYAPVAVMLVLKTLYASYCLGKLILLCQKGHCRLQFQKKKKVPHPDDVFKHLALACMTCLTIKS